MNILMLSIDDYSQKTPDPQVVSMTTLAKYLCRYGTITLATTTPIHNSHIIKNVNYVTINGRLGISELKKPWTALKNLIRLYMSVDAMAEKYDILYTDASYYPNIGRNFSTYAVVVNGLLGPEMQIKSYIPYSRLLKSIGEILQKETLKKANVVIAVTPYLKHYIIRNYHVDKKRVHYIPNGVDLERFKNVKKDQVLAIKSRYDLVDNRTFIFVGSFRPWHNVFTIIKAFSKLRSQVSDAKLLMVGDGPFRADAERMAKSMCPKGSVVFTGAVPYTMVPCYLKSADIGVHYASHTERLKIVGESPLKIGEYMASGLCVIAGPLPYVCYDEFRADAVYGVKTEKELYNAMYDLVTNSEKLEAYRNKGLEYVKKNLSMNVISKRIYCALKGDIGT